MTIAERAGVLVQRIEIDDYAIDAAPFQLVKGTSLYKVRGVEIGKRRPVDIILISKRETRTIAVIINIWI